MVFSEVLFAAVMPKNFQGVLGFNGKNILTDYAPDHVGVVKRVCWPRDERSGPTYFGEEFLSHGYSPVRRSIPFLHLTGPLRLSSAFSENLTSNFQERGFLTARATGL